MRSCSFICRDSFKVGRRSVPVGLSHTETVRQGHDSSFPSRVLMGTMEPSFSHQNQNLVPQFRRVRVDLFFRQLDS